MALSRDFVAELKRSFKGDIRLDPASRILYSTDASIYQIEPLGVVFPKTQEDLIAAVELAAKYRVPILPRGSGSSLAGQAIGEALILDCSRWLNAILDIDPEARAATVEPGVILSTLNKAAAKYGLQFGPDPASAERATMGGVIGNNATGAHSILYGMSADHLLSADVILGDGSLESWGADRPSVLLPIAEEIRSQHADAIRRNYPASWRNSAGYRLNYLLPWSPSTPPGWDYGEYPPLHGLGINMAPLLAGSEGTLAVIRRLAVNLVPKPKHIVLGVLAYADVAAACEAVPEILALQPSAIELIPRIILQLARNVPAYADQLGWVRGDPQAVLIVEFSGEALGPLKEAILRLSREVVIAESPEEQARIWSVRKAGLGILDARPQSARPAAFIEDCAIPVQNLGEFVRGIELILAEHKTEGGIYGHASGGCLHVRPVLNLKSAEGVRSLRSIAAQTMGLALRMGGSMSSEHGDGMARGEWLTRTYGEQLVSVMRRLKQAADPHGLLNPAKMLDAPAMDTHLRYGTSYSAAAWVPGVDFARNGGLAAAIEQCNGQGVCRKDSGVMCPSFQATREEQNSTRGRANLLRALISSGYRVSANARQQNLSQAVFQALDLCLACKGCKAECPSGVDMAKLKAAFQEEYYRNKSRPVRDYLFGYFHSTARWLSCLAPLVNFLMSVPWIRLPTSQLMGITSQRPFPKFRGRHARPMNKGDRSAVVFLSDPFSRFVEPQIEQAAFEILDRLGFDVLVLSVVSSGAALMSKGFLDAARRHARGVLRALKEVDPEGLLPIIGLEPPDIYALKNDYPDLLPDNGREATAVGSRTWLFEEFLLRTENLNNLRVATLPKSKIFFHPHCHQRAESSADDGVAAGPKATLELLRRLGVEVELMDAGCCGMAGTFGYEAEHYELSQQIGNLRLFPKLKREPGVLILSTGAACRMQIEQGTGMHPVHPVEFIRQVLVSG